MERTFCAMSTVTMPSIKMGPDGKKCDKPKHGGRKIFFHRLWCRIQRLPIDEDDDAVNATQGNKKKKEKEAETAKKKKKTVNVKQRVKRHRLETSPSATSDSDDSNEDESDDDKKESDDDSSKTNEETDTEDESGSSDDSREDTSVDNGDTASDMESTESDFDKKDTDDWHDGCVRLSKSDDPHWLSELQCYIRSHMLEAFSAAEEDLDSGSRNETIHIGQVGIRCVFCAQVDYVEDRAKGHVYFPASIESIHQTVSDLQRRHFSSCPEMPADVRETFKSLKGFGAKADGDTQQYWVDSVRELGMGNSPIWEGVRFYRDPTLPSPADEHDKGNFDKCGTSGKNLLVRQEDKEMMTDHASLLLRQVKPCRFRKSDRRGGPGSRGRDRVIGFPGLACIHCTKKNNFGRYFPVAPKNLADNTCNSIQSHLANCTRCPEAVKSSLAYLLHRSLLQKAELSGSWKKVFYKRVWDRLHLERAWSQDNGENGNEDNAPDGDDNESTSLEGTRKCEERKKDKGDAMDTSSDVDSEALSKEMSDVIKAAAIWLCERDADTDVAPQASKVRTRGGRGRGLPGRGKVRSLSPRGRGGSSGSSMTPKRRRVHF